MEVCVDQETKTYVQELADATRNFLEDMEKNHKIFF